MKTRTVGGWLLVLGMLSCQAIVGAEEKELVPASGGANSETVGGQAGAAGLGSSSGRSGTAGASGADSLGGQGGGAQAGVGGSAGALDCSPDEVRCDAGTLVTCQSGKLSKKVCPPQAPFCDVVTKDCLVCAELSTDCQNDTPRQCMGATWVNQPVCSEPKPICNAGLCVGWRLTGSIVTTGRLTDNNNKRLQGGLSSVERVCNPTNTVCLKGAWR